MVQAFVSLQRVMLAPAAGILSAVCSMAGTAAAQFACPAPNYSPVGNVGATTGWVSALDRAVNGDFLAASAFTQLGGVPANHIARWDGTMWWPFGSGLQTVTPGESATADSILRLKSGEVVVG